jgi:hypothetical protein
MNAKVRSSVVALVASGRIDPSQFPSSKGAEAIASLDQIKNLPEPIAEAIRDAFRNGTRWAFISLIPWAVLTFTMTLFLSKIKEDATGRPVQDAIEQREEKKEGDVESASGSIRRPSSRDEGQTAIVTAAEAQPGRTEIPEKPAFRIRGPIGLILWGVRRVIWEVRYSKASKNSGSQE